MQNSTTIPPKIRPLDSYLDRSLNIDKVLLWLLIHSCCRPLLCLQTNLMLKILRIVLEFSAVVVHEQPCNTWKPPNFSGHATFRRVCRGDSARSAPQTVRSPINFAGNKTALTSHAGEIIVIGNITLYTSGNSVTLS